MRIRYVKPEFWKNQNIATCSEFARLMALALFNYADDEGYFWSHPRLIHGELFPFLEESEKVLGAIQELSEIGFIVILDSSDGRTIGHIPDFRQWQRIDKPKPSEIKAKLAYQEPSKNHPRIIQEESQQEGKGKEEEGKGIGKEGKGEEEEAAAPDAILQSQRLFELYSKIRRSHMADALREAKACILRHGYADVLLGTQAIVAAVERWTPAEKLNFVKRPDEFFRGDHWNDDPSHWLPRKERQALQHAEAAGQPHNDLGGRKPLSTTVL